MKYHKLTLISLVFITFNALACPVCENQQPAITKGISHGAGPQSNWDWVIISIIALVTILTFIFSLKYLIKPGEQEKSHIKQTILN